MRPTPKNVRVGTQAAARPLNMNRTTKTRGDVLPDARVGTPAIARSIKVTPQQALIQLGLNFVSSAKVGFKDFGAISSILAIGTAIFFDLIQIVWNAFALVPFIGLVVGGFFNFLFSFWAFLTFYVWFAIKGGRFSSTGKKYLASFGVVGLEIIPGLSFLPVWTLGVILGISSYRKAGEP